MFPAAAKVVASTTLVKQLNSIHAEVSLLVDENTGAVVDLSFDTTAASSSAAHSGGDNKSGSNHLNSQHHQDGNGDGEQHNPQISNNPIAQGPSNGDNRNDTNYQYAPNTVVIPGTMRVGYEMPIPWEEVLAMHVMEQEADPLHVLRAQVLTAMC
jgi:hypothetical protein